MFDIDRTDTASAIIYPELDGLVYMINWNTGRAVIYGNGIISVTMAF